MFPLRPTPGGSTAPSGSPGRSLPARPTKERACGTCTAAAPAPGRVRNGCHPLLPSTSEYLDGGGEGLTMWTQESQCAVRKPHPGRRPRASTQPCWQQSNGQSQPWAAGPPPVLTGPARRSGRALGPQAWSAGGQVSSLAILFTLERTEIGNFGIPIPSPNRRMAES